MSEPLASMPVWKVFELRPDLSVMPETYRFSCQDGTITVELQAASGAWFPLPARTTDDQGLRDLALNLAFTRRTPQIANSLDVELAMHFRRRLYQTSAWTLTASDFERMLKDAAYEASGAADLDPAGLDPGAEW